MAITLDRFISRLAKTRRRGWTYEFQRQLGTREPGNLAMAYYRHVIVGVPPASVPRPLPGGAVHLWVDTCALLAFEPHLLKTWAPSWQILKLPVAIAKDVLAASCESAGHDAHLRLWLLEATGLEEIPIEHREAPECRKPSPSSTTSSKSSAGPHLPAATSSGPPGFTMKKKVLLPASS